MLERLVAAAAGALLLAVTANLARRNQRDRGTLVDPVVIYAGLWGAVLLLFAVPLIRYESTPLVAWAAIYGSIAGGVAGGLLVTSRQSVDRGSQYQWGATDALRSAINHQRLRVLWLISAVLGLVGLAGFIYAVSRSLPWSVVVTDPESVRDLKQDSSDFQSAYDPWKFLTYLNLLAFFLWSVALRLRVFDGRWRAAKILGVGSALPLLVTADRGVLVAMVVWAGMLHAIWPQRIQPKRVLAVLAVVVLVSGLFITAIGNRYGGSLDEHPNIAAQLNTRQVDPVVIPYLYLTANLPTFGQLTQDSLAPHTWGGMSVLPFAKAASGAGLGGPAPVGTGVFYQIPFQDFSNYSWLGTFWLDFRLPGTILLSAFVMAGCCLLWLRLQKPTLLLLWLTSLVLYALVFSPFANAFSNALTWQLLLLAPFVTALLDEGQARRMTSLAGLIRRRLGTSGAVACVVLLCGVVAVVAVSAVRRGGAQRVVAAELGGDQVERLLSQSMAKVESVYPHATSFPGSVSLATRLQVNDPGLNFEAQEDFHENVGRDGSIAVFSTPSNVFLRARASDGKVYEVHRTTEWGGVTFGPGTRDG